MGLSSKSKSEILRASREKEKRKRLLRASIGLGILVVIVAGFIVITNLYFLRVTNVIVSGRTSVDKTEVKEVVQNGLSGRYLFLIPRSSIFFISKESIIRQLKKSYPGLKEINISWPDLNSLAVSLADEKIKTLWCVNGSKQTNCYYLTSGGLAYQLAPNFSNHPMLEIHTTRPLAKINTKVIDPLCLTRANYLLEFMRREPKLWPEEGIVLVNAQIYAGQDFIIYLRKEGDPLWRGRVLFNTNQEAEALVIALNSTLKNVDFQSDWRKAGGRLDYLDLRFAGKVFYRFR